MERTRQVDKLLVTIQESSNKTSGRNEARESLDDLDPNVRDSWREFNETLVTDSSDGEIRNTLQSEFFFNSETLAPEIAHHRVLALAPSALTAIGVLGTFGGLTWGLSGLDLGSGADIDSLRGGINELIEGASFAFITSLAGVLLGLMLNVVKSAYEKKAIDAISEIQNKLDQEFIRQTPESSLLMISETSQSSAEALEELHERIGNRLQQEVNSLVVGMQDAVSVGMEKSVAPILQRMMEDTNERNAGLVENLLGEFSQSFSNLGDNQARMLEEASQNMAAATSEIGSVVSDLSQKFETISSSQFKQNESINEKYQEKIDDLLKLADHRSKETTEQADALSNVLTQMTENLQNISAHLENASSSLTTSSEALSSNAKILSQDARVLTTNIAATAQQVTNLNAAQDQALASVKEHHTGLQQVEKNIDALAVSMKEVSERANHSFQTLGVEQQKFLQDVETQVIKVMGELDERVQKLTLTMNNWLEEYSKRVHTHTEGRMDQWNESTNEFAQNMTRVVESMSDLLDQMPSQQPVQVTKPVSTAGRLASIRRDS